MIIREILDRPAEIIYKFDWINNLDDTKSFLYEIIGSPESKSQYTKAKTALEMLIKAEPRDCSTQGTVNIDHLEVYILNDILKRGHTREGVSKMTPDEAFDEYCEHQGKIRSGWGKSFKKVYTSLQNSNR